MPVTASRPGRATRWLAGLALACASAAPAAAEAGVPDSPRWLVVLCKFSGTTYEPQSTATVRDTFTAVGRDSVTDYFAQQSYGALDLRFNVRGWFKMRQSRGQYNALGDDRATKALWCVQASRIDPRPYDGIVAVTNLAGDTGGLRAPLARGGTTKEYGIVVLEGADVQVTVHEIAHALGLRRHSYYTTTPGIDRSEPYCEGWAGAGRQCQYGNPWDIMSAASVSGFGGVFGSSGPGFNAHNREWFGWLPPSRVATFTTAGCEGTCSRTYDLADLNTPGLPGALLLKVPTANRPGHYFTVEYHRPLGWDRAFPSGGVLVHDIREDGVSYLIRRKNGTAMREAGETWRDTTSGVSVRILSIADGRASVEVSRQLPAPEWTRIGSGAGVARLAATASAFYVVGPTGVVRQYRGTPDSFAQVSQPTAEVATNDRHVYVRDTDGTVSQFDGSSWTRIGRGSAGIVAGAASLYSVDAATGSFLQYLGAQRWRVVGGTCAQWIANDQGLFCLSPNRQAVHRYTGNGTIWEQVGYAKQYLVATATALFGIDPTTGFVERWDGRPQWTVVGGPGHQFVGNEDALYALTVGRTAVMRFSGAPGVWTQIGGPAAELAAGGTFLYALTPDRTNLMMYHR